jgi:hypothetical protein
MRLKHFEKHTKNSPNLRDFDGSIGERRGAPTDVTFRLLVIARISQQDTAPRCTHRPESETHPLFKRNRSGRVSSLMV